MTTLHQALKGRYQQTAGSWQQAAAPIVGGDSHVEAVWPRQHVLLQALALACVPGVQAHDAHGGAPATRQHQFEHRAAGGSRTCARRAREGSRGCRAHRRGGHMIHAGPRFSASSCQNAASSTTARANRPPARLPPCHAAHQRSNSDIQLGSTDRGTTTRWGPCRRRGRGVSDGA